MHVLYKHFEIVARTRDLYKYDNIFDIFFLMDKNSIFQVIYIIGINLTYKNEGDFLLQKY